MPRVVEDAGASISSGTIASVNRRLAGNATLVFVFLALAVVVASTFDRGWLPHDDGYLAMTAERVLNGEVPHRDFDEIYTGGLTYLHAWALGTFGVDLVALRIPYLAALAGFVLAVYALVRRFFDRAHSALIASSLVFLGPYMTSSPMPSSYNVFVAAIVLACLMKYYDGRRSYWLVLAGLLTGMGVLAKTTGLYLVLGVGIGLIGFHARQRTSGPDLPGRVMLLTAGLLVSAFVWTQFSASRLVGLVLPVWVVVILVFRTRSEGEPGDNGGPSSLSLLTRFGLGALVPVLLFGAFMASRGALEQTLVGLTGIPRLFVGEFVRDFSILPTLLVPLALGLVVWRIRADLRWVPDWWLWLLTSLVGILWYLLHPRSELSVLLLAFSWLPLLLPVLALSIHAREEGRTVTEPLILTTMTCAVCMQLVRFPTSNQWYIFYALPLAALGLVMLGGRIWQRRSLVVATTVIVASLLAIAQYQGRIFGSSALGTEIPFVQLQGDRGGIHVPFYHDFYNRLATQRAAREGPRLAGPDAPELYFLLDISPAMRSAFPSISGVHGEPESMLDMWVRVEPESVILNNAPVNSDPEPEFVAKLEASCTPPRLYGALELYANCGE